MQESSYLSGFPTANLHMLNTYVTYFNDGVWENYQAFHNAVAYVYPLAMGRVTFIRTPCDQESSLTPRKTPPGGGICYGKCHSKKKTETRIIQYDFSANGKLTTYWCNYVYIYIHTYILAYINKYIYTYIHIRIIELD